LHVGCYQITLFKRCGKILNVYYFHTQTTAICKNVESIVFFFCAIVDSDLYCVYGVAYLSSLR
jgi:hypothetical protein